jgi:large subunit ribosomal protein L10
MPSLRKEREEAVATLSRELKDDLQGLVVAGYASVKTPELNELRGKLRPLKARCSVVKNSLAKLALKNAGVDGAFGEFFEGPSALVIQKGDPLVSLKALVDFERAHGNFKIRAGHMNGRVMGLAELRVVASLPSKTVLLAQLLGRLQGPLYGFRGALEAHLRYLINALEQASKKKEASK